MHANNGAYDFVTKNVIFGYLSLTKKCAWEGLCSYTLTSSLSSECRSKGFLFGIIPGQLLIILCRTHSAISLTHCTDFGIFNTCSPTMTLLGSLLFTPLSSSSLFCPFSSLSSLHYCNIKAFTRYTMRAIE